MVSKDDVLAKILIQTGELNNYVTLDKDNNGKLYIHYALTDGSPHDCYNLPAWCEELKTKRIYEISGYTGDHWAFKDTKPVNVNKLLNHKFSLSINDIFKLIEEG